MKYLGAVAVNPFTKELYRLSYAKCVCGGNKIYFTLNAAVRVAAFNTAHGYPKAPVAIRTFSFEEEFKPYIEQIDDWASQKSSYPNAVRVRQLVRQMCLLDEQLCILMSWKKEKYIGEFNENGKIEYIYTTEISGGGAQALAARRHKNTIYFYMPITTREGGSVHVYKYDEEKEGK